MVWLSADVKKSPEWLVNETPEGTPVLEALGQALETGGAGLVDSL